MRLKFRRSTIWVTRWRYGLQFDVQRDRQELPVVYGWGATMNNLKERAAYTFRGHLWNWDIRCPWRLTKGD